MLSLYVGMLEVHDGDIKEMSQSATVYFLYVGRLEVPLYTVSICSYFATVGAGIGSIKKVCKKNASLVPFYALCGHRI